MQRSIRQKVLRWIVLHGEPADARTIAECTGLDRLSVRRCLTRCREDFIPLGKHPVKKRVVWVAWEE